MLLRRAEGSYLVLVFVIIIVVVVIIIIIIIVIVQSDDIIVGDFWFDDFLKNREKFKLFSDLAMQM
jgi:hypothetical protein